VSVTSFKLVIMLALICGCLFWFIPSMRKQQQYQSEEQRVFGAGQDCWYQEMYTFKDYARARTCLDEYSLWAERNDSPELGFDWPWASWKPRPDLRTIDGGGQSGD
jgi:hypothetical protein